MKPSAVARFDEAIRVVVLRLRRRERPDLSDHEIDIVLHLPVGETRSLRWIAEHFGMSMATTSHHVQDLERRGFLARGRDPDDKRRWLVELAAKGRHVVASYSLFDPDELRAALAGVDEADLDRTVALVESVAARATEVAIRAGRVPGFGYMAIHRGFPDADALAQAAGDDDDEQSRAPASRWERLSPAQRQVAELVRLGLSNTEIAERLAISRRTVGAHLSQIYATLGVASRTRLAHEAWLQQNGAET